MASYSEVKAGLDAVAEIIRGARSKVLGYKAGASVVSGELSSLATTYADVIATINGYGTSNAAEALAKADLAKLTTEFNALKAISDGIAAVTP